jgi:cytochrome c553
MRLLLVVLVLASVSPDANADARAGEKKAQLCLLCHRTGTQFGTGIPLLEGRSKQSLVADITDFKTGKRRSPAMDPNVERLTKRDIDDIADYLSTRPAPGDSVPARLSGL